MGCTHGGRTRGDPGWAGTVGAGQRWLCCRHLLPVVELGHAPNSPAAQPGILVAISPTIHRSLNQASLPSETRIQLGQGPSDGVAFGFINEPIPAVLVLIATRSWINAVFRLEFGGQLLHVDRLHVASDCIFHLHAVSGILKRDPLHAIVVLAHHERRRRRNRSWRCVRVSSAPTGWAGMQRSAIALRTGLRAVIRTDRTRGRPLQRCWIERSLDHGRFHLRARAVCNPRGLLLRLRRRRRRRRRLVLHGRLSRLMRHEHRLGSHVGKLLGRSRMLGVHRRMHLAHRRILIPVQARRELGWLLTV
jgi:hypothetical protein